MHFWQIFQLRRRTQYAPRTSMLGYKPYRFSDAESASSAAFFMVYKRTVVVYH
jgi:hypothetical protein